MCGGDAAFLSNYLDYFMKNALIMVEPDFKNVAVALFKVVFTFC